MWFQRGGGLFFFVFFRGSVSKNFFFFEKSLLDDNKARLAADDKPSTSLKNQEQAQPGHTRRWTSRTQKEKKGLIHGTSFEDIQEME